MTRHYRAGVEPSLADVMGDPIIEALMRSDGVTVLAIETLAARIRNRPRIDPARYRRSFRANRATARELVYG